MNEQENLEAAIQKEVTEYEISINSGLIEKAAHLIVNIGTLINPTLLPIKLAFDCFMKRESPSQQSRMLMQKLISILSETSQKNLPPPEIESFITQRLSDLAKKKISIAAEIVDKNNVSMKGFHIDGDHDIGVSIKKGGGDVNLENFTITKQNLNS